MSEPDKPVLKVIRGDATPEEIAAVLAVVLSRRSAGPAAPEDDVASVWGQRFAMRAARTVGTPLEPGPHGWRTSFWQR